ncbi:uncharacterized protein LOC129921575 [Episyrphus balteatus]|uniref:uncharacterized protein LOC129921575 n=1 Tax=Episyrphus balteatus TaxID=286459 RepID=UPI0024853934|nr:uncharacterized protein LOC129921575 [Episyrphus balteatus]
MLRIVTNFRKTINKFHLFINLNQLQLQHSMPYYAVAAGWEKGVYETWAICERRVKGFSKPIFKKFKTKEEAEAFLKAHGVGRFSDDESFDPIDDAVPLGWVPKKEKDAKLRELLDKKLAKTKVVPSKQKKRYVISSSEESVANANEVKYLGSSSSSSSSEESYSESDDEVKSIRAKPEVVESWPDDVNWEEDDDDILLAAAAEVEGIPENSNPLKRKTPPETGGGGPSSSSKVLKKYSHESKIWEPIGLKKIGNFEFPIDSEGFVIVYTDGSCINNGKANAVAGYGVYFSEDHPLNAGKPVNGRVTNNAGEIQAAIYAIRIAKDFGIKKLCLSTDSQFLINAVTAWMKNWKRNGWRLKGGDPVKNKEDFVIIDGLLDGSINIKWNYVKGHKGIIGNEKADRLARQGAALYKSMIGK